MIRHLAILASIAASVALYASSPAQALTAKECSAKYQQAKKDGTLGGKTWNEFRKAECAESANSPTPAPAPTPTPTPTPAPTAAGDAVYPTSISPECAKKEKTAGKQRFCTCVAQYDLNKKNNANGGIIWIARKKGDPSYWSICNKKLKGQS